MDSGALPIVLRYLHRIERKPSSKWRGGGDDKWNFRVSKTDGEAGIVRFHIGRRFAWNSPGSPSGRGRWAPGDSAVFNFVQILLSGMVSFSRSKEPSWEGLLMPQPST